MKPKSPDLFPFSLIIVSSIVAMLASHSALADTITGTGWLGGTSNSWADGTNWTAAGPSTGGSGDRNLFFGTEWKAAGGTGNTTANNDLSAWTGYRITFDSISGPVTFRLTGNAITLADFGGNFPKIENNSSVLQNVNLAVTLNSGALGFGEIDPTNGDVSLGSTVDLAGATQLRILGATGGKTVTFNGVVSSSGGANSVAINSNNIVVYKAANTYSGDTFINAGKLQFAQGGSSNSSTLRLGDTTGTATAEISITDADGGTTISSDLIVRSGSSGLKTISATNTSGTNGFSGSLFLDAPVTTSITTGGTLAFTGSAIDLKNQTLTIIGVGTTTISAKLTDSTGTGKFVKSGSGTLGISGAVENSGEISLNDGIVNITGSSFNPTAAFKVGGTANGTITTNWNATGTIGSGTNSYFVINDVGTGSIPVLNVNGGALTVGGTSSALYNYSGSFIIGGKGAGTVNIGGGTLNVVSGKRLIVGGLPQYGTGNANGLLDINSGVVDVQGTGDFWVGYGQRKGGAADWDGSGTVRIDGGTLQTSRTITEKAEDALANPTSSLIFNGGTLKAGTSGNGTWITSIDTVTLESNGGTIDTNAQSMGIANAIGGVGGLTKAGTGTLTLSGSNTYNGDTFVNAGRLDLASGSSLANSQVQLGDTTGTVVAELRLTQNGGYDFNRNVTVRAGSSGAKTISSTNTSGTNTISGIVTLHSPNVSIRASDGGTLTLTAPLAGTTNGGLIVGDSGTVNLTGGGSVGGGTGNYFSVQSGTLNISNAPITVSPGYRLNMGWSNTVPSFMNITGTTATLTTSTEINIGGGYNGAQSTGTGTMSIGGTLAYPGVFSTGTTTGSFTLGVLSTAIGSGTLNLNAYGTLATSRRITSMGLPNSAMVNFDGGSLKLTAAQPAIFGAGVVTTINTGGAIIDTNGFAGGISTNLLAGTGSGGLTKNGFGTLELTGNNTFVGTVRINEGMLVAASTNALGDGLLEIPSGGTNTGALGLGNGVTVSKSLTLFARNETSGVIDNAHVVNVGGDNIFSGTIATGSGGAGYAFRSDSGKLTVTSNLSNNSGSTYTRPLHLNGAGDGVWSGIVSDGVGPAGIKIVKAGFGTWRLTNANTYSGTTTISAGTLLVNASNSGTGAVSVASGATASVAVRLGGNGTLAGATTFAADPDSTGAQVGGIHSPGDLSASGGVGKQTFSSSVTYNTGSIFEWDLAATPATTGRGTSYDAINAASLGTTTGAIFRVVLNGVQNFSEAFWDSNRTWSDIFKTSDSEGALSIASIFSGTVQYYNGGGGTLTSISAPSSEGSFTFNGTDLNWTAVPEPTSAFVGLLIGVGLLRRRRIV